MLGDRLLTDVKGGMEVRCVCTAADDRFALILSSKAGMDTILMLTGINKVEDLSDFAFRPTYVIKDMHELLSIVSVVE